MAKQQSQNQNHLGNIMSKQQPPQQHLPSRMRRKTTRSGKTYYYYDTCAKPRKWLPLGAELIAALKKYTEYEQEYNEEDIHTKIHTAITFGVVADRYVRTILPQRSPRTQQDYLAELNYLRQYFDDPNNPAPINSITSADIYEYLEWRIHAKIRANREISLFSVIFNWARKWGYTNNPNPCQGVEKYPESGRKVYIADDIYWQLYQAAELHLQHIMLVAYLIGQRVADCLKIRLSDIREDQLWITQNKTQAKLRITITGELQKALQNILQARGNPSHDYLFTHHGGKRHRNKPLTYAMLRGAMDRARQKAGIHKNDFQFRDLRAKAATDADENQGLAAAQALLGHTTPNVTHHYIRHRKGRLVEPSINYFSIAD